MLDPDRITGSCLLARATERRSGRALSQWYGKVLRFPITRSLPHLPVSHPAGSPGRFAQTQFTVSRKRPQAGSVVIVKVLVDAGVNEVLDVLVVRQTQLLLPPCWLVRSRQE